MASKVDLFLAIRFDHEQGLSVRAIARKYGVHRRMVYQALASPVPPARKVPSRSAPVLGPWKTVIDGWLREDLAAPRKQRHTATRIHERLLAEHGAQLSYSAVQRYIKARRGQIKTEAGVGAQSGLNRLGLGAASLLEEDGAHAEALPARGSGEGPAWGS